MSNNYLITGYWGEPHVTAENDRGINAAIFGAGRYVLPVGEQFRAEYIGNNTIRLYDGKLVDNGAAAGIPVGEYVDVLIANAGQGMNRNDLIVFQYSQDTSTLIESGKFIVIQGTETSDTATDPVLTQSDLLSGKATIDQMALWRVSVSGATISAPEQVFTLWENGGGSMKLLWTNEKPEESFKAQSISLDLSKYRFIRCHCRLNITYNTIVPPNEVAVGASYGAYVYGMAGGHVVRRTFTATAEGVSVEAGKEYTSYGSTNSADDNSVLIPVAIYGIK